MMHLWLRLYAHALLRGSRIFPGIELYDDSPGCSCNSFTDTWKGVYRGEQVCVKVIRARDHTRSVELEKVRDSFVLSEMCSVRSVPDIPSAEQERRA